MTKSLAPFRFLLLKLGSQLSVSHLGVGIAVNVFSRSAKGRSADPLRSF